MICRKLATTSPTMRVAIATVATRVAIGCSVAAICW
jgi:hypothetical protein